MCTKLSQKIINNKINYDSMIDYSDHARACSRSYNYTCGVSKTMRHNSITLSCSFNVMFQPTDYLAILHSYRNWMLQVFSVDQECELCIYTMQAGPFSLLTII